MIVIIMFYELKTYSNVNVSRMLKYTVVMAISTLLEIIAFYSNLFKYTSSFYRVGLLIFIGLLVYDAYTYLKENLEQNRENLLLEKLAYMDFLTGGNNRTAYERDLDKYLESGVFRLVLLDLNDLKYINDTFGHNFGDDAIKTVYRLTREVFKNLGECYRIGGDEFVVLMNSPDKEIYEKCIEKLRDGLEKKKSESAYPIDFAAGSDVYEKENWDSYSEFYHHVDQNMYVDKINRKKSSEIIAM
jgi:diguanylate cyclase (GGDEF)-like protein